MECMRVVDPNLLIGWSWGLSEIIPEAVYSGAWSIISVPQVLAMDSPSLWFPICIGSIKYV